MKQPQVTLRRVGELLKALINIIESSPEKIKGREAIDRLEQTTELMPHEKELSSNGKYRKVHTIVNFSTVDLVKAGWFVKDSGYWFLTDEGRKANKQYTDPEEFYRKACELYRAWAKNRPDARDPSDNVAILDPDASADPEKSNNAILDEARSEAMDRIEEYIQDSIPPFKFQRMVADLLKAMGYYIASNADDYVSDGGVDIIAYKEQFGTGGHCIKVQVKRQKESISEKGLRAFANLLTENDVGIFVCTGGFKRSALQDMHKNIQKRITALEATDFINLWIKYYDKLDEAAQKKLPLTPVWYLDLE